nr:UbiA family prenyltransferase [Natronolimnobius sp. AArcel1]
MSLLSLPLSPAPIVVGLITFTIYTNDRLLDLESDAASNPQRTAFVRRYRHPLYVLSALAYGLAVALAALGGPLAFGLTLFPGVVWVLYAMDWISTSSLPIQRLKDVLFVNSTLVATAWSLTIVLLPVAYANATVTPAAGVIFGYFVLATFVNTEIANVRDIKSDRARGVSTLPTVLSVTRTRHALYGITLLTGSILGYGVIEGYVTAMAAGVLSVGLVCLLGVTGAIGRIDERWLSISAECTRLPVFALLVLFTLL